MASRTAQANPPTKERLLDSAQRLMLAKGFSATTVDDICEAAKLTKGSFFHYFESKDQLGKELLGRFCASSQRTHQASCGQESDPLKRVYRYVDCVIGLAKDPAFSQGCLLGTFAQELSDTHPEIRSMCAKAFTQWAQRMKEDLDQAKTAYAPRAAFDTGSLAEHFISILEGSIILGKAKQSPQVVERSLQHFKGYLKSLFQR